MKDVAIEALQELIEETKFIREEYSLTSWKNKAKNIVIRLYGKEGEPIRQIDGIRYYETFSNINDIQARAKNLIEGLIKEIERFGLPDKGSVNTDTNNLHINITQSQNQETKVSLNIFIEAIRDELTGSQQKELQQIIDDSETDVPAKKSRIIDKLKSFGGDVASNIVANILTNPGIYGI